MKTKPTRAEQAELWVLGMHDGEVVAGGELVARFGFPAAEAAVDKFTESGVLEPVDETQMDFRRVGYSA